MSDYRWRRWPGLLLTAALVLGPAVSAAQEDASSQKPPVKKDVEGAAEKADADEAETQDDTKKPAAEPKTEVDSSFNTIEDMLALSGPADSLWAARSSGSAAVRWREAGTGSTDQR